MICQHLLSNPHSAMFIKHKVGILTGYLILQINDTHSFTHCSNNSNNRTIRANKSYFPSHLGTRLAAIVILECQTHPSHEVLSPMSVVMQNVMKHET